MKKLLIAATAATISSSAFASEGTFYLRGDVGASMLPKQTQKNFDTKLKSSTHVGASIGVGYYVMDNVRSELALTHHFTPKQKCAKESVNTVKASPTATALSLKGLLDVYDFGMGQAFLGAGVGFAQLGGKMVTKSGGVEKNLKWKKKNNFSYLLTAGSCFDVADGVKLDVAYTYSDYGTIKKVKDMTEAYKYHFKTHNIAGGVRVEL